MDWLLDALERARQDDVEVTDEAAALEHAGHRVMVVSGDPDNFKITTAENLERARRVLESGSMACASGRALTFIASGPAVAWCWEAWSFPASAASRATPTPTSSCTP